MPATARLGDKTTGHGKFPPQTIVAASSNVRTNGIGTARMGDKVTPHSDGNSSHGGSIAGGSSSVRVNGKPVARIGDAISCGGRVAKGSGNVGAG